MPTFFTQLFVCLTALMIAGWLRMGPEQALTKELRDSKLLPPAIEANTREKLGQKGLVASLGGIRPTLASIDHIRAITHQYNRDLLSMEEMIQNTVELEPHVPFYWDTGSWMLAYNASSQCLEDIQLPPLRRSVLHKQYIKKGYDMLDKGIKTNPNNMQLRFAQGRLASSRFHLPDYEDATRIYQEALRTAERLDYPDPVLRHIHLNILYNLCRVPSRTAEAYRFARQLYDASTDYHFPSLQCILFTLQNTENISKAEKIPLQKLLGPPNEAIQLLSNYSKREIQGYPMDGVEEALQELQARPIFPLSPEDRNSFYTPMRR